MRLTIIAIGRLKDGPERELFARYADRLNGIGRAHAIGPLKTIEFPESRAGSVNARRSEEARRLVEACPADSMRVRLDEKAKLRTSAQFAENLVEHRDNGVRDLVFLIGGPDGHGPEVANAASAALSLSAMTLTHGLARVILAEQLYRGACIISGHPYHRA